MTTLPFTKGHGTRNDFVILDDPQGAIDLTEELVRALTDRRSGVGADGVIRVMRAQLSDEVRDLVTRDPRVEWFMDYRNADGSIASMCGNGVRVFARFLEERKGVTALRAAYPIATRAGIRTIRKIGDWYEVGMGPAQFLDDTAARTTGHDATVTIPMQPHEPARPGISVSMGNPHTVVALPDHDTLAELDLTRSPGVDPVPVHGTNVEFVVPDGVDTAADGTVVGRASMRVYERGVGETQSCGTGACAAAAALHRWAGESSPRTWTITVPGGRVQVTLGTHEVLLAGPAELVADGHITITSLNV